MAEERRMPDPLEIVRRSVEAASRRDFGGSLAPFSPEGIWDMSRLGMGVFQGRGAIRAFFEDWIGAYEDYEIALEEIRDLGNGVTFLVAFQRGRLADSAGFVELRYATVSTWTDGFIERSTQYTDIDEARAAAERLAEERGWGVTGHSTPLDLKRLTDLMTDAFNRRDFDGVMAMYSQSAVWDTSAVGLGIHEGREAVRAFHEDWQRAYDDFEGVVEDLEDRGNGVAITVFHQRGRPKGGSGFVELRFALVMTWADGLVEQVTAYIDIDEARAAAERLAQERG